MNKETGKIPQSILEEEFLIIIFIISNDHK